MFKQILVVLLIWFSCAQASIAADFNFPIQISANPKDEVGKRLVHQLREQIESSQFLHITSENALRLQVVLETTQLKNIAYNTSAYSIVWLLHFKKDDSRPLYMTSTVGYCGAWVVKGCAESIVVRTYDMAEGIYRTFDNFPE